MFAPHSHALYRRPDGQSLQRCTQHDRLVPERRHSVCDGIPKADRHGQKLVHDGQACKHRVQWFPIGELAEPDRFQHGSERAIGNEDPLEKHHTEDCENDEMETGRG